MTAYSRHLIKRSCLAAIIVLMGTGTLHVVVETKGAAPIRFAAVADHTYRVVGRARFLLVSFSADDVGGARLMWRRDDNSESVRLLVGSEPARAPRDLNEWAYSSEEVHGDRADAFLVRSETPSSVAQPKSSGVAQPASAVSGGTEGQYRIVCSTSAGASVRSVTTTVQTHQGITYHALDKLLDRLHAPEWQVREFATPPDASPGFLTALGRLLRASVESEEAGVKNPLTSVSFVYNSAVYDLRLRRAQRQRNVSVGAEKYDQLLKGDFLAVRRSDSDPTPFSVTYLADGASAGVPIVISFRFNWWLTIELQLDDRYEVPRDPAADPAVTSQIRDICAPAWAPRPLK